MVQELSAIAQASTFRLSLPKIPFQRFSPRNIVALCSKLATISIRQGQGRAELDKLVLAFWAGWHRRELSELLDRLNPRDVPILHHRHPDAPRYFGFLLPKMPPVFSVADSVSHLLQRHRPRSLSLEQTLGSKNIRVGVALGGDPIFFCSTRRGRLGPLFGAGYRRVARSIDSN